MVAEIKEEILNDGSTDFSYFREKTSLSLLRDPPGLRPPEIT